MSQPLKRRRLRVLILTESFPFPGGDDFLADEIHCWHQFFDDVLLMPAREADLPFETPDSVEVSMALARRNKRASQPWYVALALVNRILYADLRLALSEGRNSRAVFGSILKSTARTLRAKAALKEVLRRKGPFDLVYAYWNDTESFAAALLKREGRVQLLVSRAHGFDLYAHRRPAGFIPLKAALVAQFDRICAISDQGTQYLRELYPERSDSFSTSRLGVSIPEFRSPPTPPGHLRVVSTAYCVDLKRIDKTIDAMAELARLHPNLQVEWTHFGGGPLVSELRAQAAALFENIPNVSGDLVGDRANPQILRFYREHATDVFLNNSDTEGVPVSIMEAMSCGIPGIAPATGGIPELVNSNNGWLIPEFPSLDDVVAALSRAVLESKELHRREVAKETIGTLYSADTNYASFVKSCLDLCESAPPDSGRR